MNILEKLNVQSLCYWAERPSTLTKEFFDQENPYEETVKFKVGTQTIQVKAKSVEEAWQKIEEKCWEGLANAVGQQIKLMGE